MIKDIVEIIKDVSLRHKGVHTFRYQSAIYNNAQNNYEGYQVYVDTVTRNELNITTNIFKVSLTMHIIGHPSQDPYSILEVQDDCYTIAVDIIGYLDNMPQYQGIMSVYDYSIITISEYSDDSSAGVMLNVVLQVPSPLNLCELEDNFNDEPYSGDTDTQITVPDTEVGDLTIKAIKLPKSPKRC